MRKRLLTGSLLSMLLTTAVCAQKNYRPGVIQLHNNDTLQGFIDYRVWEKSPKKISFKKTMDAPAVEYTVHDLASFSVENKEVYTRFITWVDKQPVQEDRLSQDMMPDVRDTVFLRTLVNGDKVDLYELVDEKVHFYIKPQQDTLQELRFKRLAMDHSKTTYMDHNLFRAQLKQVASGQSSNKKLLARIDRVTYRANDLSKVIMMLNDDVVNTTAPQQAGKTYRFFAAAGIANTHIDFKSGLDDLRVLEEDGYAGYTVSAGVDLFPKRGLKNLFVRGELRYTTAGYKGEAEVKSLGFSYYKKYELDMTLVAPSLYIAYNVWRKNESHVYLGVGSGFNFTSYPKNQYTTINHDTKTTTVKDDYRAMEKLWFDALATGGVVFGRHFEAKMLYRLEGLFHQYKAWNTKNNMLSVMVGYRF